MTAVLPVGRPEAKAKHRLFEQWDVDRVDRKKEQGPIQVWPGEQRERFPSYYQRDPRNHGVRRSGTAQLRLQALVDSMGQGSHSPP